MWDDKTQRRERNERKGEVVVVVAWRSWRWGVLLVGETWCI